MHCRTAAQQEQDQSEAAEVQRSKHSVRSMSQDHLSRSNMQIPDLDPVSSASRTNTGVHMQFMKPT